MATLDPAIALSTKPPQLDNPIDQYSRALQLKTALQQSRMQDAEFNDQQILRSAFTEASGDPEKMLTLAGKKGASPNTLLKLQQGIFQTKEKALQMDEAQRKIATAKNSAIQSALAPLVTETDPVKQSQLWNQASNRLVQDGTITAAEAAQHPYPGGPDAVKSYVAGLNLNDWALSQERLGNKQKTDQERQQNDLKAAAGSLANAVSAADYAKRLSALSPDLAQRFPPADQWQPTVTANAALRVGMSPEAIATDQRTRENEAAQNGFRRQELGISAARLGIERHREMRESTAQMAGDNPLAGMSDAELARIQAIAQGDIPAPSNRSKDYRTTMAAVLTVDPTYTDARFKGKQNFKLSKDADAVSSITTALAHLDRAQANSSALGFSPTESLNLTSDQRRYHSDADLLQGEIGKLVKNGVVTEGESHRLLENLHSMSESNRNAALDELKDLMGGKFEAIRQKYKNATGQEMPLHLFDAPTQKRLVQQKLIDAPAPDAPAPKASAAGNPAVATKLPANANVAVTDPTGTVHYFASQAQADVFKRMAGIK